MDLKVVGNNSGSVRWSPAGMVCWGIMMLIGLCLFVPWSPLTGTNYYEYVMHVAVGKGWQYGSDLLTTYGPLGYLALPIYHEVTYSRLIAANIALYILFVALLWDYWGNCIKTTRPSALWAILVLLLPAMVAPPMWGALQFVPYLLVNVLVWRYFLAKEPPGSGWLALHVAVMTLFVLIKGTFIILFVLGMGVIALDEVIRRRRVPISLCVSLVVFLGLWLIAGQEVGNILSYFRSSAYLIKGYKGGMGLEVGDNGTLELWYAGTALLLFGSFSWMAARQVSWRFVGPAAVFAFTLFTIFQHGFVRGDAVHLLPACYSLVSLALLSVPLQWVYCQDRPWQRIVQLTIVIVCLGLLHKSNPELLNSSVDYIKKGSEDFWSVVTHGRERLRNAEAENTVKLAKENQFPTRLKPPVESSDVDAGLAAALGLDMVVRPTIAMYAGYTPELMRRNRRFLEERGGPETFLLSGRTEMDKRFPTSIDSEEYLALLTHFRAVAVNKNALLLQRREHPLTITMQQLAVRDVGFGEIVSVPQSENDIIWAEIHIAPTLVGRLREAAYKNFPLYIATSSGNQTAQFRLSAGMSGYGMILSPLLYNLEARSHFYQFNPQALSAYRVREFLVDGPDNATKYYHNRIRVVLFRIVVQE